LLCLLVSFELKNFNFKDNLRNIRLNALSLHVPRRSSLPEYTTCQKELPLKQNYKITFKNKLYQISEDESAPPPYPGI
jgi:hypothetical protein